MQVSAQENLKKESKMHPNTKVQLASTSAIRQFWSADQHFQSAEWHLLRLWLDGLWVRIKHIIFDFLAEGRVPVRILIVFAYFFDFQHTLLRSQRDAFSRSQISHISDPLFWNSLSYVKEVLEALVLRISFL